VGSGVAVGWSRTTAPQFSRCSVADGCCSSTTHVDIFSLRAAVADGITYTVALSVVGVEMQTEVVSLDEQNEVRCVMSEYENLGRITFKAVNV